MNLGVSDTLIHMNGRVYDQTLGRFMSADLLIPDPMDTQSYNRYSYVRNRPMFYTDPSGFCGTDPSTENKPSECKQGETEDGDKGEELEEEVEVTGIKSSASSLVEIKEYNEGVISDLIFAAGVSNSEALDDSLASLEIEDPKNQNITTQYGGVNVSGTAQEHALLKSALATQAALVNAINAFQGGNRQAKASAMRKLSSSLSAAMPPGSQMELGGNWKSGHFVKHYFTGSGEEVNLASVGLDKNFWNSDKVVPSLDEYKQFVVSFAMSKVLDSLLTGGDGSFQLAHSRTIRVNLTLGKDVALFSIGRSNLNAESMCSGGGGDFTCAHKFELRDSFSKPILNRFDFPGGTSYPIVSDQWDLSKGGVLDK